MKEEDEKLIREVNKRKALKHRLDLHKVEQNIAFRNQKDIKCELLIPEGTYQKLKPYKSIPEIKLYGVEDEEEKDHEALKLFINKHKKVFRYLYNKYANNKLTTKGKYSFDELREQLKSISIAEIIQMLKDYQAKLLSNTELTMFIKLINYKLNNQHNLTTLTFKGFIELFVQIAIYTCNKDERYRGVCMSSLECVKLFLNRFKQKVNTDFDIPTEDTIQELNKLVASNPYYLLPEGYKKIEEKVIIENYTIPYKVKISESIRISVEILDTILAQALGIHIIEPITNYKYINKVVAIPKVLKDNSYILPRRNARLMQSKHTESLKLISKTEIRVAEHENTKDGSLNKIIKNKIEKKREEGLRKEKKEQKRKERAVLLKEALEQLKREKEKKDKEASEQSYVRY